MSSRNVVFMVATPSPGYDLSYVQFALRTWEFWCQRNDVRLYLWTEPFEDVARMKPTWQRYALFDILERKGIAADRVAYVDADIMVRWDCPNFFDLARDGLGVVRDQSPRFVVKSMSAYQRFFPDVRLGWHDYFNAGFQLVDARHRPFYETILRFYRANRHALLEQEEHGLGTDQTPVNFLARQEGVCLSYLPPMFNLMVFHQRLFKERLFVDAGYLWHFAGLQDKPRIRAMHDTWRTVARHYTAGHNAQVAEPLSSEALAAFDWDFHHFED
jgi:lipopolysaccharide biosynthesis glycosyltransferase